MYFDKFNLLVWILAPCIEGNQKMETSIFFVLWVWRVELSMVLTAWDCSSVLQRWSVLTCNVITGHTKAFSFKKNFFIFLLSFPQTLISFPLIDQHSNVFNVCTLVWDLVKCVFLLYVCVLLIYIHIIWYTFCSCLFI